MRDRGRRKTILIGILVLAVAVIGLWLVMRIIENQGIIDEQFGDSGNWGGGDEIQLELDNKLYECSDRLDSYLLIGLDRGDYDYEEGYNGELADFQTLLIVDSTTKKYGFIQFDRNSMVEMRVPGYNGREDSTRFQQITLSHWYGLTPEERNENTVAALALLTGGFEADSYYALKMENIGTVNDAIGGVTVKIEEDLTEVDPAFTKGAEIKLTGKQAEAFVRARMGVSDGTNRSRMGRQTQFMQSAYNTVYDRITEDPEYINGLAEQLKDVVETDTSPKNISKLTNQLITYENVGILKPEGETKLEDTRGDGNQYEAFYMNEASLVSCFQKIMDLREVTEEEQAEEEEE